MRSRTTRRAFSLVELLIVIAILGVLAAILFPVFARARESGRLTDARSRLRDLHRATEIYAGDWHALPFAVGPEEKSDSSPCLAFGNDRAKELCFLAPSFPRVYALYGVPVETWFMDEPRHDPDRGRTTFGTWEGMNLLSEPYERVEARPMCPLYEERPAWRSVDPPRTPRLCLFPNGSVRMMPISFAGLDDSDCFIEPMRGLTRD